MAGEGSRLSWPRLWVAIYGLSLAVAVAALVVAFTAVDWYVSDECSYQTNYEHSIGIMGFVPVLLLVGLIEIIVAAVRRRAWPRHVALGLGLVGGGVMVLSFAALVQAGTSAMPCD